ncbi:MAG: hypothetical protein P4L45_14510 [Ignavibacteriaceae bacterium]|nr:hypothetical protein [Ignavibacteriaceae bacterium]
MKYLILFLVVISLPLLAQKKKNNVKIDVKIQMTEWMAKISSDPELREAMIEMILDNTKGNKEEMTKFGSTIMNNPEMNSIIAGMVQRETSSGNVSVQSLNMAGDSTKTMKTAANKLSSQK